MVKKNKKTLITIKNEKPSNFSYMILIFYIYIKHTYLGTLLLIFFFKKITQFAEGIIYLNHVCTSLQEGTYYELVTRVFIK